MMPWRSFRHSLKVEAIHDEKIQTREMMIKELFDYIELAYNINRYHSSIGNTNPVHFKLVNAAYLRVRGCWGGSICVLDNKLKYSKECAMHAMKVFDPTLKIASQEHIRLYAIYEMIFTLVDFAAAFLFIVGSILFFSESTTYAATWLFLIGSICFALKPSIRVFREYHLLKIGKVEVLSKRASE